MALAAARRKKVSPWRAVFVALAAAGLTATCLLPARPALAADATTSIEPALLQLTLGKDQLALTRHITITNHDTQPHAYKLFARDFGSLNESGGILFYGSQETGRPYRLTPWLKLSATEVTVPAQGHIDVPFDVINNSGLTSGGHYGAVIVQKVTDSTGKTVGAVQSEAGLLFVQKTGGERYELKLDEVQVTSSAHGMPTVLGLRFKNLGNTHVVPRGKAAVVNRAGKEVAAGSINEASAIMLPGTTRTLATGLRQVQPRVSPGRYTLRVAYRFDGKDDFATYERQLWISPLVYVVRIVVFITAVVIVIITIVFVVRRNKAKYRSQHRT